MGHTGPHDFDRPDKVEAAISVEQALEDIMDAADMWAKTGVAKPKFIMKLAQSILIRLEQDKTQKYRVLTPSDPRILAWKELGAKERNVVFGVIDESRENFVLNGGISISDWLLVAQKALEALSEV